MIMDTEDCTRAHGRGASRAAGLVGGGEVLAGGAHGQRGERRDGARTLAATLEPGREEGRKTRAMRYRREEGQERGRWMGTAPAVSCCAVASPRDAPPPHHL